ncbi:MAG: FG-GAP-like repeat-containing protein [bacterium]
MKYRRIILSLLVLLFAAVVIIFGCEVNPDGSKKSVLVSAGGANPPVISSVTASPAAIDASTSCVVGEGNTTDVVCQASDADGDTLTYAWSAEEGLFSFTSGSSVTWLAPTAAGVYTISCQVSDGTTTVTGSVDVAVGTAVVTTTSTTTTTFPTVIQKNGEASDDLFGHVVASAGDVNNDGYPDFIVGAPDADPDSNISAGSAYVYSGNGGAQLFKKNGAAAGDLFGLSAASAGDVNGDGYADFIVGAYYASPDGKSNAGSAYVYSGQNGNLLYQKDGEAAGDCLGFSVAGVGDVNKDGYDDFIVGAYVADPDGRMNAGSAYVYSGLNGNELYQKDGENWSDYFGQSVAGAGDVNKDGYPDFIVGADWADPGGRGAAGSVYVYSGLNGNLLYQKDGEAASDYFGYSVASAGDVNNDGYDDFIIGARGADLGGSLSGSAYVYSGLNGQELYQKDGAAAGDWLGWSVAGAGDVDNDGYDDFIIGAPSADPGGKTGAGSAYIYSGQTGNLIEQKDGLTYYDDFGFSVSSAGDVDGDGKADVLIGARDANPPGLGQVGSVYLYITQ